MRKKSTSILLFISTLLEITWPTWQRERGAAAFAWPPQHTELETEALLNKNFLSFFVLLLIIATIIITIDFFFHKSRDITHGRWETPTSSISHY